MRSFTISLSLVLWAFSVGAADFDRNGFDDLVIGDPFSQDAGTRESGALLVVEGRADGLSAVGGNRFHQGFATIEDDDEPGDHFGASFAACDFDGDRFDDLVVGVPDEDLSRSGKDHGMIHVFYGSIFGLRTQDEEVFSRFTKGLGTAESGDRFGAALTAGYFGKDRYCDLAIGVPGARVGSRDGAGAVIVLFGGPGGLTSTGAQALHQDVWGIAGVAETNDGFGSSLASGRFDGDGVDDLAIGVPDEDVGSIVDAGGVQVIYGGSSGLSTRDQFWDKDDLAGGFASRAGSRFGAVLAAGRLGTDAYADLAIGTPDDQQVIGGTVVVLYGRAGGLSSVGNQLWTGGNVYVPRGALLESPQRDPGDAFGASLTIGDWNGDGIDELAIGAPGEDPLVDAGGGNEVVATNLGTVHVIFARSTGLSAIAPVPPTVLGVINHDLPIGAALAAGRFSADAADALAIGAARFIGAPFLPTVCGALVLRDWPDGVVPGIPIFDTVGAHSFGRSCSAYPGVGMVLSGD